MVSKAFDKSINTALPYPFLSILVENHILSYIHIDEVRDNFRYSLQVDAAAVFKIFLKHLVKP